MMGRNRLRRVITTTLSAILVTASGCQSGLLTVTVPHIEHFTVANPQATNLDIDRALNDQAEIYAKQRAQAQTWKGAGLSMEPLIPPESWIVTETIPFEHLNPGQVVLYLRSPGRRVAHALVKKTRQGWIMVGVNNRQIADPVLLTRARYIGVVTAAFVAKRVETP